MENSAVIESYDRLKNLKLVESETGVKWQTVYCILKKNGVEVCGDKARYGSVSDRVALIGEQMFKKSVPFAIDNNDGKWQPTVDFEVNGVAVDIKTANITPEGRAPNGKSFSAKWAFCVSKQKDVAEIFILYALAESGTAEHILLIPCEVLKNCSTISIPESMKSKWADYEVSESDLFEFFESYKK